MSKSLGNVIDPRMVIGGGKDAKKVRPRVRSMPCSTLHCLQHIVLFDDRRMETQSTCVG